jgi:hypothetical protein
MQRIHSLTWTVWKFGRTSRPRAGARMASTARRGRSQLDQRRRQGVRVPQPPTLRLMPGLLLVAILVALAAGCSGTSHDTPTRPNGLAVDCKRVQPALFAMTSNSLVDAASNISGFSTQASLLAFVRESERTVSIVLRALTPHRSNATFGADIKRAQVALTRTRADLHRAGKVARTSRWATQGVKAVVRAEYDLGLVPEIAHADFARCQKS